MRQEVYSCWVDLWDFVGVRDILKLQAGDHMLDGTWYESLFLPFDDVQVDL